MQSEAVKLAKLQTRAILQKQLIEELGALARNPMVLLVGTFITVEALQKWPTGKPLLGPVAGTALETAVVLPTVLPGIVDGLAKASTSAGSLASLLAVVPK